MVEQQWGGQGAGIIQTGQIQYLAGRKNRLAVHAQIGQINCHPVGSERIIRCRFTQVAEFRLRLVLQSQVPQLLAADEAQIVGQGTRDGKVGAGGIIESGAHP